MTPAEIIYHRRVRVLAQAKQSGNVAATCRTFGISRTRFYEWRNVAELYGLEALMPKARRVAWVADWRAQLREFYAKLNATAA